jgi:hypothetical protein
VRSQTILTKDPLTGKVYFVTRSVLAGQQLADLEDLDL